ncbi:MAG TPA: DNA double-strand break repair protein Mre11, partial [Chloroflexia bacterium]|nr:DNA double-strand break repair protein Mre11 [Chloroflexia bacterium]
QKPSFHVIDTKAGPVQIIAIPWLSRSYMLSNKDFRNLDPDSLNREMINLVEGFIDQSLDKVDASLPVILTAHASVQGAVFSTEKEIMLGQDVVYPKAMLMDERIDYVAMGHIHKHQVLSQQRPPIVYPGSLERIDFGEERDAKGFVSVDISDPGPDGKRAVTHTFHEVGARPFRSIKVNADCDFPTEEVLRRIEERAVDIQGAIVRLIIDTSPEHQRDLRQDEIRQALNSHRPAFMAVTTNYTRAHRMRLGDQVIEQMTPRDALSIYLRSRETPPDRVQNLLGYYDKLSATVAEAEKSTD